MYQPVITPPLPENLEQYVSKDFTGNVYGVTTRDDEGRADTNLPMIALDDLPFAALTKTSLRNGRLTTLRSIAAQTPEELYCLRGIGEKSYLAIVALLKEHGVDDQPYLDYMKSRHKNQGLSQRFHHLTKPLFCTIIGTNSKSTRYCVKNTPTIL